MNLTNGIAARFVYAAVSALLLACGAAEVREAAVETSRNAGIMSQGIMSQGIMSQGIMSQGIDMSGNPFDDRGMYWHSQRKYGAKLKDGTPIHSLQVVEGTLQGTIAVAAGPAPYSSKPCSTTSYGLTRNCGWTVRQVGSCKPYTTVRVAAANSCTQTLPLGSSTGDTMLRICDGQNGCDYTGYKVSSIVGHSDNSCGVQPSVTFTCPAGGRYTVMTAPYASYDLKASSQPAASAGSYPAYETVQGEDLVGAELLADEYLPDGTTGMTGFSYRITSLQEEKPWEHLPAGYPYAVGTTYLYGLEHQAKDGTWVTSCGPDAADMAVAIPTEGTWDHTGQKVYSRTHFTFACTSGVMGKCYRWGYRPWEPTATPSMWDGHQACTRLARADYCGNGYSWTKDGTTINMWDAIGPDVVMKIEADERYNEAGGFLFEAGWDEGGARCLSHYRWYDLPEGFAADQCPERLRHPEYKPPPEDKDQLGPTVCDSQEESELSWPTFLYDKSKCNGVSGGCESL